jgi:hypothetical protein
MESLEDAISRIVFAAISADNAKVEAACEDALQGGTCGVFVIRSHEGRVVVAEVNVIVPYGEIYEVRKSWLWRA